ERGEFGSTRASCRVAGRTGRVHRGGHHHAGEPADYCLPGRRSVSCLASSRASAGPQGVSRGTPAAIAPGAAATSTGPGATAESAHTTPAGRGTANGRRTAMTRTPPAFGTQATRLHAGRILLVLTLLVGAAITAWVWVFHKGAKVSTVATESSTNPGWTASQLHYDKPEVKAEAPAPQPVDMTAAQLAQLRT